MPAARAIAKLTLIALLAVVALVYAYDYVSVRIRMRHATATDPFETITSLRILAIDEKGNKTEYDVDPTQPQQTGVCVHALFPHNGDMPCWYLKRKFAQPIPMVITPFVKSAKRTASFAARYTRSHFKYLVISVTRGRHMLL